ncbi:hypothetical protein BYT27DRAFT_7210701 [Phlegmacium glaucopus]|nr:hypothetical protein BYT27DRAFT_7210701 [Phlegmacium glaucopus]
MIASFGVAAVAFLLTLQPALALAPDTSANNIFARQSIDPNLIPSSCFTTGSGCSALSSSINNVNCATLDCICTTAVLNGLKSCYQCVVSAGSSSFTQADADGAVSDFAEGCAAAGFPISGVSTTGGITGGSNGGLGSGGLGGSTNTATAATTAKTATSTGSPLSKLGAASKISVGTFGPGVMVVAALGAIALL